MNDIAQLKARLRELEANATKGDWRHNTFAVYDGSPRGGLVAHTGGTGCRQADEQEANAEFIAAARNAIIPLLDALDAQPSCERVAKLESLAKMVDVLSQRLLEISESHPQIGLLPCVNQLDKIIFSLKSSSSVSRCCPQAEALARTLAASDTNLAAANACLESVRKERAQAEEELAIAKKQLAITADANARLILALEKSTASPNPEIEKQKQTVESTLAKCDFIKHHNGSGWFQSPTGVWVCSFLLMKDGNAAGNCMAMLVPGDSDFGLFDYLGNIKFSDAEAKAKGGVEVKATTGQMLLLVDEIAGEAARAAAGKETTTPPAPGVPSTPPTPH